MFNKYELSKNSYRCEVYYFGLLSVLLLLFMENSFSQKSGKGFEEMKGTLFTHVITDRTDTLGSKEITELRDDKGVSLWFSREIFLNVCLTGECRLVRVRIYWTGAATYLGLVSPEDYPLTKADHSVFTPADYEKLDQILSVSLSILKRLKINDLIIKTTELNKKHIDGHSGATQPSLSEYVVKNSVYTCYSLWQTVYGSTLGKIRSIIEQRTDDNYLRIVFSRKNPKYLLWAIDFVRGHPQFHPSFYREIMNLIRSEDINISQRALHYFTPALLSNPYIQKDLARVIEEASSNMKFEIIWKLSPLRHIDNDAILILLEQFESQKLSAGLLGYVYMLIHPDNMEDARIEAKIKNISKDNNLYVRNITEKILSEKRD